MAEHYRRLSGTVQSPSHGAFSYDCFPGLNKLCLKQTGQVGGTVNFLVPFDVTQTEVEKEILLFLENGKKNYINQ